MMCFNQCDYPGENGKPCRCEMAAQNAFDSKLQEAVVARLSGVGTISPELWAVALQDIAEAVGCAMNDSNKAKVEAILRETCPALLIGTTYEWRSVDHHSPGQPRSTVVPPPERRPEDHSRR